MNRCLKWCAVTQNDRGSRDLRKYDASLPLPDGLAIAYASVKPGPSLKVVRESNPDNNEVTALVGLPSRR
jgi:hypothetical protein